MVAQVSLQTFTFLLKKAPLQRSVNHCGIFKANCYVCCAQRILMTKLFVTGLPKKMDEMGLAQLFAPTGDIDLLTILCDKITGRSKGAAFVHMKTDEGANEAIAVLDGFEIGDNKLEVRLAGEKPAPAPKFGGAKKGGFTPVKNKRPRLNR